MLSRKIVITVIVALIYCTPDALSREIDELTIYKKAQKLLDEYEGDSSLLNKAQELTQQLFIANPNSEYAYVLAGRLAYKAGYINYDNYDKAALDQAKEYILKAIDINPDFFDAHYYGSYAYLYNKEYESAKQMAREAEKIDPGLTKVDILYGDIAEALQNYDEVIKRAKSAISKKPDN